MRRIDAMQARDAAQTATPRGRFGLRAGLRRDAFEVGEAERLVHAVANEHATREEGPDAARGDGQLLALRVLVAEVKRRARAYLDGGDRG